MSAIVFHKRSKIYFTFEMVENIGNSRGWIALNSIVLLSCLKGNRFDNNGWNQLYLLSIQHMPSYSNDWPNNIDTNLSSTVSQICACVWVRIRVCVWLRRQLGQKKSFKQSPIVLLCTRKILTSMWKHYHDRPASRRHKLQSQLNLSNHMFNVSCDNWKKASVWRLRL